jgi:aspartate aminotransferase-like enzyme
MAPEVREAMAKPSINPDVEAEFGGFYRTLLDKLATVYDTDDDILVLGGEGMLGLEASVASLLSPGDEVLCLANGLFGAGFADFAEMHGGDATVHDVQPGTAMDPNAVKDRVEDGEFAVATMVHCETPTGVLNELDEILATLQDAGVGTVVDVVSSLGGTPVPVNFIDICLGASQKCFSSPPGLTTVSVSDRAWATVDDTEQDTFYTSFAPWKDVDLSEDPPLLPYTHLASNLAALDASLDRIVDEGVEAVYDCHAQVARQCREIGLEPYPDSTALCSPTLTAFHVPGRAGEIQRRLDSDRDAVAATGLGESAEDVLRIGHMGYAADSDRIARTMDALADVMDVV